ncbi:MAG: AAA family ATPase [Nitrosotalea sp.]
MSFTLYSATGEDFVGREKLVKELTRELASNNKIGFSLSGVRRIGKTSILKEVEQKLKKQGIPVIYISVWQILPTTIDEFTRVLDRTALNAFEHKLPKKFKFEELLVTGARALRTFLLGLNLSAKVAEDLEISISYVKKESEDVEAAVTKSISLIEHLAAMTKTRCVLMIDEFPSIVDLTYGDKNRKMGFDIAKLIRTLFEDFRHTKLVVSGSYRDTLDNLVGKTTAPFYKQLLLRGVEPFTTEEFNEFINHYLPHLKFADNQTKEEIYKISSGIPYNLQLLGKEIQLQDITKLDRQKLGHVIKTILAKEGEQSFKEFTDKLTPSEIKVLKALAKSPRIKPSEIGKEEFMSESTVSSALVSLSNKTILKRQRRGIYEFADTLFAEWLKISEIL